MMPYQRQTGFTLVELMVAMAIGTIIILGAGQLFLTTFQTFRTVEELSRKQETVVFAANTLVNAYRSGNAGYTLEETKDSNGNKLDECSIIDTQSQATPQPIVGGLAQFDDRCNTDRFVSPDENISGYYKFTLEFKRGGEGLEILEFHVMDREKATEMNDSSDQYQVGTGDAIIAGGSLSGVGSDLLQGDSRTSSNMFSHNIPDPRSGGGQNSTGYIENFKNLDGVVATCDAATISTSNAEKFYCNSNINNLNVDGLSGKIVVAENGVSIEQNGNTSVNDLAIVAGGAVNINGNNDNAIFGGVVWSAGSSNISASGVDFQGSVVAGGAVSVNNASSITADWNTWDILSEPGYEFSMAQQFNNLGTQINMAEERE